MSDEAPSESETTSDAPGEASSSFELPEWVEESMFRDFLGALPPVLEEVEAAALAMGESEDEEKLAEIKRRVHTLKGEAYVLGLDHLGDACHGLETYLEECAPPQRSDAVLVMIDWTRVGVEHWASLQHPPEPAEVMLERLGSPPDSTQAVPDAPAEGNDRAALPEIDEAMAEIAIEFVSESLDGLAHCDTILLGAGDDPLDPEQIDAVFRAFHTLKGVAGFLELDAHQTLAHEAETVLNLARDKKIDLIGEHLDLALDATAALRKMVEELKAALDGGEPTVSRYSAVVRRCQELTAKVNAAQADNRASAEDESAEEERVEGVQSAPRHEAPAPSAPAPQAPFSAPAHPETAPPPSSSKKAPKRQAAQVKETVRVDLDRVDHLVEMVGELVIIHSMLQHDPALASITSGAVRNHMSQLAKISRDLQDMGMRMRMVPVRGVFQKMARMVRDLARKSGKEIEFIQDGESTEMDRSMVERLSDPLVHMIRNAVDHGIEPPADREAAGKPRRASIQLRAYYVGNSIAVEIVDDGRGLNKERILARARERGIVKENDQLSDQDIYQLIFAPGFSTAEQVTELSGRGVGMDVVVRNIEAMRGRISISTQPGKGTTFTMVMPLTLAIIDGMLIRSGNERFIIPTLSIVESVRPTSHQLLEYVGKVKLLRLRGQTLPLFNLGELLDIPGSEREASEALAVVVECAGRTAAIVVDEVITQQQVVIKSLGPDFENARHLSGAAILSDGRVGLILNPDGLADLADGLYPAKQRAGAA
jgi:two-component system chemotaxis sensor kinase CheA